MESPIEDTADQEHTSTALVLYAPLPSMPAVIDLDTLPLSDEPSTSTVLIHVPRPSEFPHPQSSTIRAQISLCSYLPGRNMSKSEDRAEMAATGGYDPDGKIFVMDKALVDGIVRVLEDWRGEARGLHQEARGFKQEACGDGRGHEEFQKETGTAPTRGRGEARGFRQEARGDGRGAEEYQKETATAPTRASEGPY